MGKKLRNRELLSQTDYQNEHITNQLPISSTINKSNLRHHLKSQIYNKKKYTHQKRNRFQQRLEANQFTSILNPSSFECPICLELIVSPVMMRCGHIYCQKCLESNTAYTQKCCLCRQQQQDQPSVALKFVQILIEYFILPSTQQTIKYLCRTTDSNQWIKRRKLGNFKQGLVIDFQDRWGKWRRGVISKNLQGNKIEVKTIMNGVELFQKIERNSNRIAPFTFFTRGRYLQDFIPTLPQYDPTQNSLINLQYRLNATQHDFFQVKEQCSLNEVEQNESIRDEMLQLFDLQMRQNQFIFNID